jgi:hypothetical protein
MDKPVKMNIQELLMEVGLPPREIGRLLHEIRAHNEQYPEKRVQELVLRESIDQVLMTQLPFIGRAIASVRGDRYLDSEGKFPLELDENALRYAAYKLDKYYRRVGTKKEPR